MRVLIVGNSPESEVDLLRKVAEGYDAVYVTDGAIHRIPLEVQVSVICGDFDSIDIAPAERERPDVEFVHLPDQEMNDLEKALLLAEERGAVEVGLMWIQGGRVDHSLANISVMLRHHKRIPLHAYHGASRMWVLSGSEDAVGRLEVDCHAGGQVISILSLSQQARITARNLKWPLENEVLLAGSRGVSNVALGGLVSIEVFEGVVVVTVSR